MRFDGVVIYLFNNFQIVHDNFWPRVILIDHSINYLLIRRSCTFYTFIHSRELIYEKSASRNKQNMENQLSLLGAVHFNNAYNEYHDFDKMHNYVYNDKRCRYYNDKGLILLNTYTNSLMHRHTHTPFTFFIMSID